MEGGCIMPTKADVTAFGDRRSHQSIYVYDSYTVGTERVLRRIFLFMVTKKEKRVGMDIFLALCLY
jgi:hypothetical protein